VVTASRSVVRASSVCGGFGAAAELDGGESASDQRAGALFAGYAGGDGGGEVPFGGGEITEGGEGEADLMLEAGTLVIPEQLVSG
jgi:hypothetical protein